MAVRTVTAFLAIALAAAPALADDAITIPFAAEIGGAPFSCSDTYPLGSRGAQSGVLDFRIFVSNVALVTRDGQVVPVALAADGVWQTEDAVLLDFEDGSGHCRNGTPQTNLTLRGHVPEGDYAALRFDIGLPFGANHADVTTAASPLNLTAMFWNWQGGHKFVKFEVAPDASDSAAGGGRDWFLHLGSTMCESLAPIASPVQPCRNPNRVAIGLDGYERGRSVVVVDPAPALSATDIGTNAPGTSPGCMSVPGDSDCNAVMPRLGLPFDGAPAEAQVLVTLR